MFEVGELVRLIRNPEKYGAFQGAVESGGMLVAKVSFPGSVQRIPMDQLEPVPATREEPIELLRAGKLGDPRRLRQVLTHTRLAGRLADIFYSMEASNTEFHAHQFKPVLKMLNSPTDGLLIADEVGLGKTIEAALIWTELRARYDYSRLLVVCPKVLCAKWQLELSSRFALDARIFSAAELLDLLRQPERAARGFVAVCSLQGLQPPRGWDEEGSDVYRRPTSQLARFLEEHAQDEPMFDLCVIDEAHHLRNPETQRNRFATLLRPVAQHRIFLSATPIQLRERDLFSLLTLLDPETFQTEVDFSLILEANRPLVTAREAVGSAKADVMAALEQARLHPLLWESRQIDELVAELGGMSDPLSEHEQARVASRLEQINLLANVVNRTRRRDVEELRVVRQVNAVPVPMSEPERQVYEALSDVVSEYALARDANAAFLLATPQRMLTSCIAAAVAHWSARITDLENEDAEDDINGSDEALPPLVESLAEACRSLPSAAELELVDTKFARFITVVGQYLEEQPEEKIVVFSTFRATLRYLERRLKTAGIATETIHGGIEEREEALARFRDDGRIRILLSSEVGSEGIDLQFCRAVVNYDMPWNPMRVEQRIGRVDRLGQRSRTISVINLLSEGTIDERIYSKLYSRLEICEQALGSFEATLGEILRELTVELLRGNLTPQQEEALIDQKAKAIATKRQMTEQLEAEAASLIAHGDHVLREILDAREMNRWITAGDLATFIGDSLETLFAGCRVRELGDPDHYEITLTAEARMGLVEWLERHRLPRGSRFEREFGPLICRFGRPDPSTARRRNVEVVGQMHPFVKFLSDRIGEHDASRLRPAVAVRIPTSALSRPIAPGRYSVMAELWRFRTQVEIDRLAYSGIEAETGRALESDDAEALANGAIVGGASWLTAETDIDLGALADKCQAIAMQELEDRYRTELSARSAEQLDRSEIQLRNLERRFNEERGRLTALIDRQRRSDRVKGNIIAANEGRLRKLQERTEHRRRQIETARRISSQQESLFVLAVEVVA
jgi:superfamily II DNA or RNA helicase